jgi:hypothetical protein
MLQQKYFKRRLIDMKQVRRSVKQILFSLTLVMVFFINIHPVMAQEISNESKNAIWNEFEEKRENGLEVYELLGMFFLLSISAS